MKLSVKLMDSIYGAINETINKHNHKNENEIHGELALLRLDLIDAVGDAFSAEIKRDELEETFIRR